MASNPLANAATNTDMKWAFPNLVNPTIIDLSKADGQTWWQFRPDEDVIFIGADAPRTAHKLQTDGGRNIVVLGGEYAPTEDSKSATLHFLNLHGSVHVEGAHIDMSNAAQDGIAVAGASGKAPTVTVQNTIITGVHGTQAGIHGDVFQTHGTVGDMRFYNVTADTSYQGFFIAPQYNPTHGSADFENVNLSYNGGSGQTYLYWFLDGNHQQAYPVTLKNVYATERSGQSAEASSVWPKAGMGDLSPVRVGDQITWPGLPYKGSITVGEPASDFAKPANLGLNFTVTGDGIVRDGNGVVVPAPVPGDDAPAPVPGDKPEPTVPDAEPTPTPTPTPLPPLDSHPESGAPTKWIKATDPDATMTGTSGNDQIAGVAGAADKHLEGGKGDDTYIVGDNNDTVIERADEGIDTVLSYAPGYVLADNVENLILGGTEAINATGNDLDNRITGNGADNVINGGKGDDLLIGGAGNDTFVIAKDEGNDIIADFSAGDVVQLDGFGLTGFADLKLTEKDGNVTVDLEGDQVLTFRGIKAADLSAESFTFAGTSTPPVVVDPVPPVVVDPTPPVTDTDLAPVSRPVSAEPTRTITADGSETVRGTKGHDRIEGNGDGNVMAGGRGSDTYVVTSYKDKVIEKSGQGLDTVESHIPGFVLPRFVENLTLKGDAMVGIGNSWHNLIIGNDQDNILIGVGGNNVLAGGKGADILVGGSGENTFRFDSVEDAGDIVKDYVAGKDNLDIRGLLAEIGSDSTRPATDGIVELLQDGAHTQVMVNVSETEQVHLATLENTDAQLVMATADHWA